MVAGKVIYHSVRVVVGILLIIPAFVVMNALAFLNSIPMSVTYAFQHANTLMMWAFLREKPSHLPQ